MPETSFDFIVVGSGAGGGVLAARLARNDRKLKVLLIDAGEDPGAESNYQVPAFHPFATEDKALRWDYFVKHFTDSSLAQNDNKMGPRGIFYPRASALGGCTAHHAMITVYPDISDWNDIATRTGDPSWRHEHMWRYFLRATDERRGYGWLGIEAAGIDTLWSAAHDPVVRDVVLAAAKASPHPIAGLLGGALALAEDAFLGGASNVLDDPNHLRQISGDREGLYRIPLSIKDGERRGVTEFLLDTNHHPLYGGNLTIWPGCLVTKVLIENERAIGVEYFEKPRAYRADRDQPAGDTRPWADVHATLKRVTARREVVLCAGSFNTPQLLMLSGIGPEEPLRSFGIDCAIRRDGVGRNLQDRYEIPVIDEFADEFALLADAPFTGDHNDRGLQRWKEDREGLYTTNGGTIAIMKKSAQAQDDCDLFIFGIPGQFAGYELGYSLACRKQPGGAPANAGRRRFSWIILKAHTENFGEVTLQSADPRDPPAINFHNFKDGLRNDDPDLLALVEAVGYVREFMQPFRSNGQSTEWLPGAGRQGAALTEFIKTHAWGHHASCTCKMGRADDPSAVVDGQFRVIGLDGANLRVVDASVFPKIPGYFIVLPIYLIAEKAADTILSAHGAQTMATA